MEEMSQLVKRTKSLDLAFGFPNDYEVSLPTYMKECLEQLVKEAPCLDHQYSEIGGESQLIEALANVYSKKLRREIDGPTEVTITAGALSALYCFTMEILEPEDEVIIFEPYFDFFLRHTLLAKAKPVIVPLRVTEDGHWYVDMKELESKFTDKTRLMIVNTPHNPTGKMFTGEELKQLAQLCVKHSIYCLADEVYELLSINDGTRPRHVHIASMPDMWCRTVTVSSGGKAFGITGWRLGWACGPSHLIDKVRTRHMTVVYTCPPIIQKVVAVGLEKEFSCIGTEDSHFCRVNEKITDNVSRLARVMESVGMRPLEPDFGYYVLVDIREFAKNIDLTGETGRLDVKVCKWLCRNIGVGAIPGSCLYYCEEGRDVDDYFLRVCAVKSSKLIEEVEKRISSLKNIVKKD